MIGRLNSRQALSQLWKKAALSSLIELTQGIYAPHAWSNQKPMLELAVRTKKSSGGGIRTPDTRIMIPLL